MITSEDVLKKIEEMSSDRGKTLAEFIATIFKDKIIEIYLGDSYEEVSFEQVKQAYPAVFCGKVVGAFKECLVINAGFIDPVEKKFKLGNLMFISERAIRALNEINGHGVMEDMFLRSRESLKLRNL